MSGAVAEPPPIDPSLLVRAATAPGPANAPPPTPNFFDQFDPAMNQQSQASAPPAQPASTPNFFDQFDPANQPTAPARDALGGYLLPQQPAATPVERPSLGQRLDQYGRSVAQGASFGWGDELAAAGDAATHGLLGRGSDAASFGDRYDANLAAERAKDAAIPAAIAIPGQLIGGAAAIVGGAPAAIGRGVVGAARLIPGVNALADIGSAAVAPAANVLSRIPGAATVAPLVAEGAGYGALQGAGDADGDINSRIHGAEVGAATGAVLAPAVGTAAALVGKGAGAVGRALSEAGWAPKNVLADIGGAPIVGTKGEPVTATAGQALAAGQQLTDAASNPENALASLGQVRELVPGSQPTTFQATGDTGLGQKELALRNTPGASQAFIDRANQQNTARVAAIDGSVPQTASSADTVNALQAQQAALAAQQDTAMTRAQRGTLQGVGGATDGTPTQAGADLRGAIDQTRAPMLQQADQAVQQGQQGAQASLDALGGAVPAGTDPGTAAQHFGRQFRAVLDSSAADSKVGVSRLYSAIDPDGTLGVNMAPARAAGQAIVSGMSPNAAPLSGEEAAIFGTVQHLPDVQSFRDLSALNNRVTSAMRAARSGPTADPAAYARLSQLRGGMGDIMQNSVEQQAAADGAAVQAGQMAPNASIVSRWQTEARDFFARRDAEAVGAGGSLGAGYTGNPGARSRGFFGADGTEIPGGRGPGDASRPPSLHGQAPPLTANADQASVDRINAANSAYATHKETYGVRAPGVGTALAPGPTSGTFRLPDSSVPSAIFSRGAGAAERVQAAIRAGLSPAQIGDYAAFDLRRAAQNSDGTLDPARAAKWRQLNGEAFDALTQADPTIGRSFNTAQQQAQRLAQLQQLRTSLDTTHPLKPGWGDAEVMTRVWQPGPKGADSVRTAASAANGSPVASRSIADYAAYSLRKMAAPDGVLDPTKYQAWTKTYDGALSARPDIKAQFDTVAKAQEMLNAAAEQHAQELKDFQAGAAKHFLGGADPARQVGSILRSKTALRDMTNLAQLTEQDPDARAGIQAAIRDHIFASLKDNNAIPGASVGDTKLKSDQFQTFINNAVPAMRQVMTPEQVDTMQKVAADLQRANLSVQATRVAGGSDTTQKAGLVGGSLLDSLKSSALTGGLTLAGFLKGGPVGGFLANKAGTVVNGLRAAGIQKTDDLVKEAMLNPALARVLMMKMTEGNRGTVGAAFARALGLIAAQRGGHAGAVVQQSMPASEPMNALAEIGLGYGGRPQNALAGLGQ